MSEEVQIRGRDFVGYRIGGAIAALLLFVALAWQTVELFDGDNITSPEVRWSASVVNGREVTPGSDADSGLLAQQILAARTRMQEDRQNTGRPRANRRPDWHWAKASILPSRRCRSTQR